MLQKKYVKSKDEFEVTFQLNNEAAQKVTLVCEANGWEPVAMKKNKEGVHQAKLRLAKDGKYQFRYLVDETSWVNDEAADEYCTNEHGSENSVVTTFSQN